MRVFILSLFPNNRIFFPIKEEIFHPLSPVL